MGILERDEKQFADLKIYSIPRSVVSKGIIMGTPVKAVTRTVNDMLDC